MKLIRGTPVCLVTFAVDLLRKRCVLDHRSDYFAGSCTAKSEHRETVSPLFTFEISRESVQTQTLQEDRHQRKGTKTLCFQQEVPPHLRL